MDEQDNTKLTKSSWDSKNVWTIIISIIATALVAGGIIFIWQQMILKSIEKNLHLQISLLQNQINQLQLQKNQPINEQINNSNENTDTKDERTIKNNQNNSDEQKINLKEIRGNYKSQELKITFKFPYLPGEINYNFNEWPKRNFDPTGTLYNWSIKRKDIGSTELGYTYSFAGGASNDLTVGRDRWITDNYQWIEKDGEYYLQQSNNFNHKIEPIKIISRKDGLVGLIFDPNSFFSFGPINPEKVDRAAILNFPKDHLQKVNSITFYFYDQTSIENIEEVLNSVEFN